MHNDSTVLNKPLESATGMAKSEGSVANQVTEY
jgi:hypothetical protein